MKLLNMGNGKTYEGRTIYTKYYDKKTKDFTQIVYFFQTHPKQETEHVVGYGSVWIMNDGSAIEIALFTTPELDRDFLIENKPIFDQIISSFRLL